MPFTLRHCYNLRYPISYHADKGGSNGDDLPSVGQVLKITVKPLGEKSQSLFEH